MREFNFMQIFKIDRDEFELPPAAHGNPGMFQRAIPMRGVSTRRGCYRDIR